MCYTFTMKNSDNTRKTIKKARPFSLKAELAALILLLLAVGVFCLGAGRFFLPERRDYGATWDMFLEEEPNSIDALFLGSSLSYCDVVPAVLYQESGLACYVMAGPKQPMALVYHYLSECLRTQTPDTVFVECTGLLFECSGEENEFIKANIAYMPWGINRLLPTLEYTSGDVLAELLFPLGAYHMRWPEIRPVNFTPMGADPLAGYTFLDSVCLLSQRKERIVAEGFADDPMGYGPNLRAVEKIARLCDERGINLVFYFAPSMGPAPAEWKARIMDDFDSLGLELTDLNDRFDEFGFDISTDFFDSFHLNCRGAEKFSRWLGQRLGSWVEPSVSPDPELWEDRVAYFYNKLDEALAAPIKYKDDTTAAAELPDS